MQAPHRTGGRQFNSLLAFGALLASLAGAELVLRILHLPREGYFVLVPGTDWKITAVPSVIAGVSGVSHYRVNSRGIRGREFGNGSEYRILAVGGSTTECAQLDTGEVWTDLVDAGLDSLEGGRDAWVGNVGRSGLTTREHALHLKYLLPQYARIHAVIAMVGLNDLLGALRQGWAYQPPRAITDSAAERETMSRAFQLVPGKARAPSTWYQSTALGRLFIRARMGWRARQTYDLSARGAPGLVRARRQRNHASVLVDSLPPLEQPLSEFRRNVNAMIEQASANQARLVFVTTPSIWRERMTPDEEARLWFGWIGEDWSGSRSYFTTGALARAMAVYNRALLDACREKGIECVDAAALVPRDTTMFYDDVHFTEAGSAKLAAVLTAYFKRQSL